MENLAVLPGPGSHRYPVFQEEAAADQVLADQVEEAVVEVKKVAAVKIMTMKMVMKDQCRIIKKSSLPVLQPLETF